MDLAARGLGSRADRGSPGRAGQARTARPDRGRTGDPGAPDVTGPATVPVVVVNAGSSSLKLSVVIVGAVTTREVLDPWDGSATAPGLRAGLDRLASLPGPPPAAVGHRVVHGGQR